MFKRVFGLRTADFLKILTPGIEQLSLQKYTALNKDIPIFPLDTVITSRKKYLKSNITIEQSFHDNLYCAKKPFLTALFMLTLQTSIISIKI